MENMNIGQEFDVRKYDMSMYQIGTFVFNYREEVENGEKFVEIDVYKLSHPVVLYIKTYRAPYFEETEPVGVCEALYEEFYLAADQESEDSVENQTLLIMLASLAYVIGIYAGLIIEVYWEVSLMTSLFINNRSFYYFFVILESFLQRCLKFY